MDSVNMSAIYNCYEWYKTSTVPIKIQATLQPDCLWKHGIEED